MGHELEQRLAGRWHPAQGSRGGRGRPRPTPAAARLADHTLAHPTGCPSHPDLQSYPKRPWAPGFQRSSCLARGYLAAVARWRTPHRRSPLPPRPRRECDGHWGAPARDPRDEPPQAGASTRPGHRRLLLRAGGRLTPGPLRRLVIVFERDDPTNEIGAAWGVKERLRQLLAARPRHTIASRHTMVPWLHGFYEAVVLADMPDTTRLAESVEAWLGRGCERCVTRGCQDGQRASVAWSDPG
jgi:hypothetical protein